MCKMCGYMMSHEQPGAGAEFISLDTVREKFFRLICKTIKERYPQARTVLDVGSSTGHFLKITGDEGFSITGLEPDVYIADNARLQGHTVINGFFPNTESLSTQMYDIIIFNDSLEHITNLGFIMRHSSPLHYYTIKGLWGRISCKSPFFFSIFAESCMVVLYPLSKFYNDCFMACFSFFAEEKEDVRA